jgi:hypothetical protein
MPVSKITLTTAMRARDVSRPQPEDLAEAAEREDALGRPRGSALAETAEIHEASSVLEVAAPSEEPTADIDPALPDMPSRRRRRRGR